MKDLLAKIVLILTLKCDQASLLMSEAMDRKLTLSERLALRGHLIPCRLCKNLKTQFQLLRDICRSRPQNHSGQTEQRLSPAAAARIQAVLQRHMSGNGPD